MAKCIYENGFLKEVIGLSFYDKLNRFEQLISLNKRAATNTVHISLNFGIKENIGKEKLIGIASIYMEKIGFGNQPYLIYQHLDAGHPHMHIVTTNIQHNGKRISLHNLGKNQSAKARKEIETVFNLVKAKDHKKEKSEEITPLDLRRLTYGKSPTKSGITNVLDAVLPKYKYASLAELNAILKLYNLVADRGKEGGIIFKKNGLVYRILDEKGNKIGVPIKASSIHNKPTLSYLETKFKENEVLKQGYKKSLKTSIDWIMIKRPKNLEAFKEALEKEKINLVVRQNNDGIIYGLTYIDHKTKCVFNGSDIGKEYSARFILSKCGIEQLIPKQEVSVKSQISNTKNEKINTVINSHFELKTKLPNALDVVLSPEETFNYVPYQLRKQKKKKRKSQ